MENIILYKIICPQIRLTLDQNRDVIENYVKNSEETLVLLSLQSLPSHFSATYNNDEYTIKANIYTLRP